MEDETYDLIDAGLDLDVLLDNLRRLNAPDSPARSRELSLAITHIETGELWLGQAAVAALPADTGAET